MQCLGIDIGGSGIKGAPVATATGELTAERERLETPQPATPDAVADTVARVVDHFDWEGPIGCTFPAVVRSGVVHTAANVDKTWIGTDAATLFGQRTGRDVVVMNDADLAGVAEMQFGAGKGVDGQVVMITLGTGIGSALFYRGVLVPNTELGHIQLDGRDAEEFASGRVREDDDLGWKEWGKRVGAYLHALEDLLWPDLFILGGGVSKKSDKFLPSVDIRTPVVPATLLNNAGIVGAALMAAAAT
ncbi:MAG: ROK family protein [Actinobacteria bacterium]|nr:ROK family protein [Actinomycetota bacterium]MBV9934738.1 ROK family protein [Actinomycetota bacterium]